MFIQKLQEENTNRKIRLLTPAIDKFHAVKTLLDFGCGDMSLVMKLKKTYPKLAITGVDVVDFGVRTRLVSFQTYGGTRLPFRDKSFNIVLSYHVLHHCHDPFFSLRECVRVSKKYLLIVEPVPRRDYEIIGMKIMDCVFNLWKSKKIDFAFQFQKDMAWKKAFKQNKLKLVRQVNVELLPAFFPTGVSYLYILKKQ